MYNLLSVKLNNACGVCMCIFFIHCLVPYYLYVVTIQYMYVIIFCKQCRSMFSVTWYKLLTKLCSALFRYVLGLPIYNGL